MNYTMQVSHFFRRTCFSTLVSCREIQNTIFVWFHLPPFYLFCVCVFFFFTKLSLLPYYSENVDHLDLCVNCINSQKCLFLRHLFISLIRNSFKMINFISLLVPLSSCQSPSRFMKGRGQSVLSKYHKKKGKRENIIYISAFNHI